MRHTEDFFRFRRGELFSFKFRPLEEMLPQKYVRLLRPIYWRQRRRPAKHCPKWRNGYQERLHRLFVARSGVVQEKVRKLQRRRW